MVGVATIAPYQLMSSRAQAPERSILLTRPTNGFYGVYAAIKEGNIFLLLTALMTILSEFLPILLSNVPYNLAQTLTTHVVCARISISILGVMILVVLGSLFIRWPHMPVDPRSIAGAMYYVSGSHMLSDFAGVSAMNGREREQRVKEMGKRYFYGEVVGQDGRRRAGVDGDTGFGVLDGSTAYVGGQGHLQGHRF
jgi:fluoride exporter